MPDAFRIPDDRVEAEVARAEADCARGIDLDFSALPVDEIGALYAALVGWEARIDLGAMPGFVLVQGERRKRLGAFYTPSALAEVIVEQTVGPLIDERPRRGMSEEQTILALRVCDPAAGCGHFLLAAARYLGARLARAREERDENGRHRAVGDVIFACLHGVDRDPLAVEIARSLLWIESSDPTASARALDPAIRFGDSLDGSFDWPREFPDAFAAGGFDAVIGNPPFGNAIEARTGRGKAESVLYQTLFPEVARGAYDRSSLFLGLAPRLLHPNGRFGLICPRATASARGAAAARDFLFHAAPPRLLWCPDSPRLFGSASVFVCVVVAGPGPRPSTLLVTTDPDPVAVRFHAVPFPATPEPTWWSLVHDPGADSEGMGLPAGVNDRSKLDGSVGAVVHVSAREAHALDRPFWIMRDTESPDPTAVRRLGDVARAWAGCTTAIAYAISPGVLDDRDGATPRLVTTGAIDRYKVRWGARPIRFLHRDYRYPRWPRELSPAAARACDRQRGPKLLVAGLSRVVEATLDPVGDCAGVVSTLVIAPRTERRDDLSRLLAVLNSARFSSLYFEQYGAKQLSGGNCTVGKVELLSTPVPPDTLVDSADPSPDLAWRQRYPDLPGDRAAYWREVVRLVTHLATAPEDVIWRDADARLHGVISALYGLTPEAHDAVYAWWNGQARR